MTTELQERRRYLRRRHHRRRILFYSAAAVAVAGLVAGVIWVVTLLRAPHPADIQQKIDAEDWISEDLLPVNDYSRPGLPLEKINALVIHYVGNPGTTAEQNRSYYAGLADSHKTSASSNFLIGLDGEIVECVPVDEIAYCSNRRNDDTLSIECCHPDDTGKFNKATYASLVRLTAWLCAEFDLDSGDVIRHYDVTGKMCPKYFVDHEDAWTVFKNDVQKALDAS